MHNRVVVAIGGLAMILFAGCSGDGSSAAADFCRTARDGQERLAAADATEVDAIELTRELAASAPSEIKEDAAELADYYDELRAASEDGEALHEIFARKGPAMEEAGNHITEYLERECDIEPADTTPTAS